MAFLRSMAPTNYGMLIIYPALSAQCAVHGKRLNLNVAFMPPSAFEEVNNKGMWLNEDKYFPR